MLRLSTNASIKCARIPVIGRVAQIRRVHNDSLAIANFAVAVTFFLHGNSSAHWAKRHATISIDAGKRLTLAARSTFGVLAARHTGGARVGRSSTATSATSATSAILAYFRRAGRLYGEGQEEE